MQRSSRRSAFLADPPFPSNATPVACVPPHACSPAARKRKALRNERAGKTAYGMPDRAVAVRGLLILPKHAGLPCAENCRALWTLFVACRGQRAFFPAKNVLTPELASFGATLLLIRIQQKFHIPTRCGVRSAWRSASPRRRLTPGKDAPGDGRVPVRGKDGCATMKSAVRPRPGLFASAPAC